MSDPLTAIPKPDDVRAEISRLVRQLDASRQLLKLAEKVEKYKSFDHGRPATDAGATRG